MDLAVFWEANAVIDLQQKGSISVTLWRPNCKVVLSVLIQSLQCCTTVCECGGLMVDVVDASVILVCVMLPRTSFAIF